MKQAKEEVLLGATDTRAVVLIAELPVGGIGDELTVDEDVSAVLAIGHFAHGGGDQSPGVFGDRGAIDVEVNVVVFGPEIETARGTELEEVCAWDVVEVAPVGAIVIAIDPAGDGDFTVDGERIAVVDDGVLLGDAAQGEVAIRSTGCTITHAIGEGNSTIPVLCGTESPAAISVLADAALAVCNLEIHHREGVPIHVSGLGEQLLGGNAEGSVFQHRAEIDSA